MTYLIEGKKIKSQNAAKSYKQKSRFVEEYLKLQPEYKNTLDFGCGKLRYSENLIEISRNITFLDSFEQINRPQKIYDTSTTVKDFIKMNYEKANCEIFENIENHPNKYDFIFCSNVLSAIPCEVTFERVLNQIYELLTKSGKAVIINQHRNSYFNNYIKGEKHFFGYIYEGKNGYSYYGLINNNRLIRKLKKSNLNIKSKWVKDQVSFVEVNKTV